MSLLAMMHFRPALRRHNSIKVNGSGRWQTSALGRSGMNAKRFDVGMCLAYGTIGFSPIIALSLAIIGLLPLSAAALILVVPSIVLGIGLSFLYPSYGKVALKGLLIGLIAVFLYDCMRVPFILAGIWGDFIPKISTWLLNTSQPNWLVGYAWRYLGDGGGMGMAFVVAYGTFKPRVNVRLAAVGFGVAIWFCLLGTLLIAPHGQDLLFHLTLTTVSLSLFGHLIYGAGIGICHPAFCPRPKQGAEVALWEQQTVPLSQNVTVGQSDGEMTIKLPRLRTYAFRP